MKAKAESKATLTPVAVVAARLRVTREIVIRRITMGELRGELRTGRWLAELPNEQSRNPA